MLTGINSWEAAHLNMRLMAPQLELTVLRESPLSINCF